MADRWKAAIVGCGRIGCSFDDDATRRFSYTHATAWRQVEGVRLAALCDTDGARVEKYAAKFGVEGKFTDVDGMLSAARPDIVSICTWNDTHLDTIRKCAGAGVKAVFCEKPLTDRLASAREAVEVCRSKGVLLQVDYVRRFDRLHQEVKRRLADLGTMQQVRVLYTAGLANTGSHVVDMLRYFLGDVATVQAWPSRAAAPNALDVNLEVDLVFGSGVRASMRACDVGKYLILETDLVGENGRVVLTHGGMDLEWYARSESSWFPGAREVERKAAPFDTNLPKDFLRRGAEALVESLEKKTPVPCSGEDGAKALEVICAAHESVKQGSRRIDLPLRESDVVVKSR